MRYRILLLLGIWLSLAGPAPGQAPETLFTRAQQRYDAGEYEAAIELYQQVLHQGYENAPIHYNLGNAYFKIGETGEAILHYEKAKRLDPRDGDISFNLGVANLRVQDRITPPEQSLFMRIFNGMKYLLNLNELAWTTLLLFFTGSLLFVTWRRVEHSRVHRILGVLLTGWSTLLLLVTPLLISRTLEAKQQTHGIILQEEVRARSAPQEMSTEVFILHEGTRVEIEDTQYQWYKIKLLDNKEGWIFSDTVGII